MRCNCGVELFPFNIYRRGADEVVVLTEDKDKVSFFEGLSDSRQIGVVWAATETDADRAIYRGATEHNSHVSRWGEKWETDHTGETVLYSLNELMGFVNV
jgi:hypothetical protein